MDKTIGILGCTGTVGRHITEKLLKHGVHVIGGQRRVPTMFQEESKFEFQTVDVTNKETLVQFCERCDIVINCISPVYLYGGIVAKTVGECNKIYLDLTTVALQDNQFISSGTYVVAAGYVPGLSEFLPKVIAKREFDTVERVIMYQGGTAICSDDAFVDIILSMDGSGYGDAYLQNGEVQPFHTDMRRKYSIPGYDDDVVIKPVLSNESILMGKKIGARQVYFFNIYEELSVVKLIFNSARCAYGKDKKEAASKIREYMQSYRKEYMIQDKAPYAIFGIEMIGKKSGEKKQLQYYLTLADTNRMCGYVVAEAALSLLKMEIGPGVYYAYDLIEEGYFDRLVQELSENESIHMAELPMEETISIDRFRFTANK